MIAVLGDLAALRQQIDLIEADQFAGGLHGFLVFVGVLVRGHEGEGCGIGGGDHGGVGAMAGQQGDLLPQGLVLGGIPVGVDAGFDRLIRDVPGVGAFALAIAIDRDFAGEGHLGRIDRRATEGGRANQLDRLSLRGSSGVIPIPLGLEIHVGNQPAAEQLPLFFGVIQIGSVGIVVPRVPHSGQTGFGRFGGHDLRGGGGHFIWTGQGL